MTIRDLIMKLCVLLQFTISFFGGFLSLCFLMNEIDHLMFDFLKAMVENDISCLAHTLIISSNF